MDLMVLPSAEDAAISNASKILFFFEPRLVDVSSP